MRLDDAVLEFGYAKDHSPASRAWYASRLGAFVVWARDHGCAEVEALTAPLIRRYVDEMRTRPARRGGTLSSHTLHGHVRAIRALLNWAARDDLLDEKVARRVVLPKREQKVLAIFTPRHVARLLDACATSETPEYAARDKALLAVLLDTGARAAEVCGLTLDRCCFTADDAYLRVDGKGAETERFL